MTATEDTPSPDLIPLENLRRLDLRPGDRLAVIAPDWIISERDMGEFSRRVHDQIATYLDVQVVVFAPGTKLEIVAAQQQPAPHGHDT